MSSKLLKTITNKPLFKLILAIFLIELLSLISIKIPILSAVFFILILIGATLFTLYKLEYGLWIALIELMIGSQGYLFFIEIGDFRLSIRIGIFLAVFFIWLFKYFNFKEFIAKIRQSRLIQTFLIFIAFLGIGVINGIINNNGFTNIFFDVNGYLYFGLFFVFLDVFKGERQFKTFLHILFAALIYSSAKIFITLYFFTHGFTNITDFLYTWIRDTRVGEITWAGGNFFRIFLQSQIWSLIAIFVVLCLVVTVMQNREQNRSRDLRISASVLLLGFLLVIIQTSILISFSRSYWLGGVIGMTSFFAYLLFIYRIKFKPLLKILGITLIAGILSIALMLAIVNFPIPEPSVGFSADMIKDRFSTDDAAASSRWNLLPPLLDKIKSAPILGTGFGTKITYQTEDPRIKNENNPEGWYTTYSFEWGYLDTITEIGVIGLLIYLVLIGQIAWQYIRLSLFKITSTKRNKPVLTTRLSLTHSSLLIGLIVLLTTHAFSPYLNHPLGIGYLMLCAGIFYNSKHYIRRFAFYLT